jgi:hypothetical protein
MAEVTTQKHTGKDKMNKRREALLRRQKRLERKGGSSNRKQFKPKAGGGKNKDGKFQVRLAPWNPEEDQDEWNALIDLEFHYNIGRFGFLGLSQFGEDDPVQELINELREEDSEGNKTTLKKLYPKRRINAKILDRDDIEKGFQFWQFGPQLEKELINIMLDEENGDILDYKSGLDIKVTVTHPEGEDYPTTSIAVKRKESALGTAKQIAEWEEDAPNLDTVYEKKSYAEIKEILNKWHSPEASSDEDEGVEHTAKAAKKASKEKAASDDEDVEENIEEAFADLGPDED